MQAVAAVFLVAALGAYLVIRTVAHAASAHLALLIGAGFLVVAVIIAVTIALVWGATHHTMMSYPSYEKPRRKLPEPAEPRVIAAAPARPEPFSSDSRTWAELVEQAERAEARQRAIIEGTLVPEKCEGPGCAEELDDDPWVVMVEEDGAREEHRFCSAECSEAWEEADKARHAEAR